MLQPMSEAELAADAVEARRGCLQFLAFLVPVQVLACLAGALIGLPGSGPEEEVLWGLLLGSFGLAISGLGLFVGAVQFLKHGPIGGVMCVAVAASTAPFAYLLGSALA